MDNILRQNHVYGIRMSLNGTDSPEKLLSFCIQPTKDTDIHNALDEHFRITGLEPGNYRHVVEVKDFGIPDDGTQVIEEPENVISDEAIVGAFTALNQLWEAVKDTIDLDKAAQDRGISPDNLKVDVGAKVVSNKGDQSRVLVKVAKDTWHFSGRNNETDGVTITICDEFLVLSVLSGESGFTIER